MNNLAYIILSYVVIHTHVFPNFITFFVFNKKTRRLLKYQFFEMIQSEARSSYGMNSNPQSVIPSRIVLSKMTKSQVTTIPSSNRIPSNIWFYFWCTYFYSFEEINSLLIIWSKHVYDKLSRMPNRKPQKLIIKNFNIFTADECGVIVFYGDVRGLNFLIF